MACRIGKHSIMFMVLWVFLIAAPSLYGESIPQLINYNGTLTDTNGASVPDGNYDVTFNIYDAPTSGTVLWTEVWNVSTTKVIVSDGSFNAMLGAHTPIPKSFFADHPVAYLGVKVGNDSEMLPRQRITSVGYAFTAGNGVPKGAIMMWSGALDQIPEGWAICDGNNGTPDLRDRFVVGAGSAYAKGATGGEAQHTLTSPEMPSHTHAQDAHTHIQDQHRHAIAIDYSDSNGSYVQASAGNSNGPAYTAYTTPTNQNTTAVNQYTGGGAAHNNLPPYLALAYIMKL